MSDKPVVAVRLLPIYGKYYETSLPNYGPQRIWAILPGNEEAKIWGTPVPPDVAYELLMIRPDVVKLAPPQPGESWADAFTPDQLEDIKSKSLYGYPKTRSSSAPAASAGVDSASAKAISKDLEAVKAENRELKSQLSKLSASMEKLIAAQTASTAAPPKAKAQPEV